MNTSNESICDTCRKLIPEKLLWQGEFDSLCQCKREDQSVQWDGKDYIQS